MLVVKLSLHQRTFHFVYRGYEPKRLALVTRCTLGRVTALVTELYAGTCVRIIRVPGDSQLLSAKETTKNLCNRRGSQVKW